MNNVLLPIRCRLDAMDTSELPAEMREQFKAVRKSVAYLQQLSDGLHLLALDPDDLSASSETTDLTLWWNQVGGLLRKAVPRERTFEARIPERLPLVSVAPHRLTQAVLNLVVNAGEATDAGGRVLVWAEPSEDRRSVRLGVTDNGRGMTDEVRRHALDPFFTTKKRGLGTGLGLPLVRGVVQSAGGTLSIDSAPGLGTTVTLVIPASEAADVPAEVDMAADVSISDARVASMVVAYLAAAGFDAKRSREPRGRGSYIWITESTPGAEAMARRYLRADRARRVVVFGNGGASEEWTKLGALLVEHPEDFGEIRARLGEAISAVMDIRS
jgi:hypothetical protein